MPEVFISYRQTSDTERERVRAFAERLRSSGIRVILDQFFLEDHPGGPNDGWDKWSSDRALHTRHVIIIGSESWFQCFDKTQLPGTGLGAACEADDVRLRVYEANGIVETIRVVLFDDADSKHISLKLKRYHRFHADRDFDHILRWLRDTGTTSPSASPISSFILPTSSFRSNLPTIQRFFGRDTELAKLLPCLHPDATGWGTLIDGPGGMGKTTLAIRAAELAAPGHYDDIVFLSAKQTAMDPHGQHDESPFAVSGFAQMLDAIARRIEKPEITQAPADERPRLLIDALTDTRTLLVLDNLETLTDADQRGLFAFLGHIPRTCKALITSRPLVIATGRRLNLQQLDQIAALQTLADIARDNPVLAAASEADLLRLITETNGNTLLLTWTAWQVGMGECTKITDALAHLRSCPQGNNPLQFIFGDLLARFPPEEEHIVATLSYPTEPIPVTAIAEISGVDELTTRRALKLLTNRSIVVPQEGEEKYALVPMVAEFIRHARHEVVKLIGEKLEQRAAALIEENGYTRHAPFEKLEREWASISPALNLFMEGPNVRLQKICNGLDNFLEFTGRWDEMLWLCQNAEKIALGVADFDSAGRRAFWEGWAHRLMRNEDKLFGCSERVDKYWPSDTPDSRKRAMAIRLRGHAHMLRSNFREAIECYKTALVFAAKSSASNGQVAECLNCLAIASLNGGDALDADHYSAEALRVAHECGSKYYIANLTGRRADVFLLQGKWQEAEAMARIAMDMGAGFGRQSLIANNCRRLAASLAKQSRFSEAKSYARRAMDIYKRLKSPDCERTQAILDECERSGTNMPHL